MIPDTHFRLSFMRPLVLCGSSHFADFRGWASQKHRETSMVTKNFAFCWAFSSSGDSLTANEERVLRPQLHNTAVEMDSALLLDRPPFLLPSRNFDAFMPSLSSAISRVVFGHSPMCMPKQSEMGSNWNMISGKPSGLTTNCLLILAPATTPSTANYLVTWALHSRIPHCHKYLTSSGMSTKWTLEQSWRCI